MFKHCSIHRLEHSRLSLTPLSAGLAVMIVFCPLTPTRAAAQEAGEVNELPAIVVEGATLQSSKAPRKSSKTAADNSAGAKPQAAVKSKQKSDNGPGKSPASAPGDPETLPGEAAATPEPASGAGNAETSAGIPIDRVGSAVSVVTGAELKSQQIRTAADAIRSLPGVHVSRSNGVTGLTQVRIRGAEGNHTLVLIDGVKANDATNGEFDFSDLSTDDIERIEVIRGAQSSIYGAGAVGGVINIVTRSGKGPLTFKTFGETGSFSTREAGAAISAGSDNVWGRVALTKRTTGGFNIAPEGPEKDGGELATFALKGGFRIFDGLTFDGVVRHTDKSGDRDTEGVELGRLQAQTDDPANFNHTTWLQGAGLTWEAFDGVLTQAVRATRNETHRTDDSPLIFFKTDYLGETINYAYTGTLRFDAPAGLPLRNTITWFTEKEKEAFTPNTISTDPFFGFTDDGVRRPRGHVAYAGEWQGDFADRLIVTAGVRKDDNDTFEDFTTWRTTATLRIPELGLRPHGSAGTAVKAPTMFEQYGTIPLFFTPNPLLLPEESFGWDAGLEIATPGRRQWVDVTYFDGDLRNQIDGFAPGPNFTFTAVNREGTSTRKGLEVSASAEIVTGLTLSGAYTYLEAKTPDGLDEVRRPRHAGRADLNYRFDGDKGNVSVGAMYNGRMDDPVRRVTDIAFGFPTLVAERFTLDDYLVVNLAASYKVLPGVELYGRLENAFNEDYQEIFGFETAGVAAYAGVRLSLEVEETRPWSEGR